MSNRVDNKKKGRRGLFIGVILFLCAAGIAILRAGVHSQWLGVSTGASWAMVDFKNQVYYPVAAFWNGGSPYDRAKYLSLYPASEGFAPYLPGTFVLYFLFILIPINGSSYIYFFLTITLTVLLAYVALKFNQVEINDGVLLWVAALILLSRPGQWNLLLGQVAVQMALATYVALYYARRSALISGLGLAVSMLKFSFGLPLALLMLARRDKRAVLVGAGITAIINLPLVAVLVHRASGVRSLAEQLIQAQKVSQMLPDINAASSLIRIDATALISRFLGHSLTGTAQLLVALTVLGMAMLAVSTTKTISNSDLAVSDGIICLAILLSLYHQAYDLLLLVLPTVALVYRRLPSEFKFHNLRRLLLGLYTVLAVNYASTASLVSYFMPGRQMWLTLASINGVVLSALFLIYLWLKYMTTLNPPPLRTNRIDNSPAVPDFSRSRDER